jgi:UDP-N-acetylmuramoyl-L-alanyl-D-glutamate--2,6-diaminopimelate ligase
MQLDRLVSRIAGCELAGPEGVDIRALCYDSREATPGSLFVALRGAKSDGHRHLAEAIGRGAVAVMVEADSPSLPPSVACLRVTDTRLGLAQAAAAFFHHPSAKLKVAGVTGTNGKTTTTFLLKHICERAMQRCGLIGTVRYEIGEEVLPSAHTTPESLELQALLARMREAGCKAAVLEVSSHAIAQQRVSQIEFDVAVFTNLTQDHLDYHVDLQSYFNTKASLFTAHLPAQTRKRGVSIVNIDDRFGQELVSRLEKGAPVITYGVGSRADFRASNFKTELAGTSYQLDALGRSFLVRLPLIGKFNIYNSLAALAAAHALGLQLRGAVLAMATAPSVPGRLQLVAARRNYQVFVDYAHTDDALHNVLRTLRDLSPNRLIVVFGCGGNRDRAKRPLMAQAAEQWADHTIVTSDNPRGEEPQAIIRDIEKGFQKRGYEVVVDRRQAIERAVALAQARDIVLIAGKGHESGQQFAHETLPFDDVQVAQAAIEARPVELN